jgi:hypothetical protein
MHGSTDLIGSPVYIVKEDKFYIITIHSESDSLSTGIYFNEIRVNVIKQWVRQHSAKYRAATENSL